MNPDPSSIRRLEPLAIIGIGCRYPGNVQNLDDLWNLLINKTDAISDYPVSRIPDIDQLVDANRERDKIITKRGGFIEHAEYFDAGFFNISPLEAEKIDPAQRLLLEVTQEAIENAGLTHDQLQGSDTGVFVGNWTSDYEHRLREAKQDIDVYATTGSGRYALSGRLSYFYNLQGPSMTVDTACSSSIVALNIAMQSLNTGECSMAFVGASNTITDFFVSVGYSRSGLLSDYGECRFGDERSTGYVRSEGAAMIIVKRLSDALKDGDRIHALVLSTACNSDGQSHKNLFAPSAVTQEVMIRKAIQRAGVDPKDIVYVEAHGTGTKAGDPAEIRSIWNAVSDQRTKEDTVYAGSVKTNFGHTESAAGLAGILKTIVSIKHRTILPSLHFDTPNPKIKWEEIGLKIPKEAIPWPEDKPLIAGVNTFGITGTNAHAIVAAAPETAVKQADLRNDIFLLPLSARSESALPELAKRYAELISKSEHPLEDICAMAALQRTHFSVREVFVAKSREEMVEKLNDYAENNAPEQKKVFDAEDAKKTVFVFPGQGAQWIRMGKALMEHELVYRATLEEISSVYKQYVDWDLLEEIAKGEGNSRLNEIDIVQPVLVAVEIALAGLWMSKGVFPDIVVGHSMGEVAAAYVAGSITLHEAAQIIITRSRLMKQVSGKGEMGATDLSVEEAKELLKGMEDRLSVAVMNSEHSTVLSGDPDALNTVFAQLEAQGRFNRKVKVDVASHSPQMDSLLPELQQQLQTIQPKDSSIQFYSTAFNVVKAGTELDAAYWAANLRNPVQFGNAIQSIAASENADYIEMSPHPTLLHAIQENVQDKETKALVLGSFVREKDEQITFYENYTTLHTAHAGFDWKNIYPSRRAFVELPTYAWQKERYWIDVEISQMQPAATEAPSIQKNFYEIEWEEIALTKTTLSSKVLLIKDALGLHSKVEEALVQKGASVKVIDIKDEISGTDADIILHMASLNKDGLFHYDYENSMGSLHRILRSYANKSNLKMVVVTNGANVLEEDKFANLNASLLTGVLRTLQHEYSNINIQQIDLSNETREQEVLMLADACCADTKYKELALRKGKVFSPVIVASPGQQQNKMISSEGVYVVTGGNNGLGLHTVQWLIERGAKHIAILSRSGAGEEAQQQIRSWAEANQVSIISLRVDVSDKEKLSSAIQKIRSGGREIKGVFHAAGILDDSLFENLSAEKFEHVLQAKAFGALNLHELFTDNTLDLFVVYSSVMGILGSAGQSNYAAANTFLDALVHYRRKHHLAGTSVNWGTIADIGLAARQENRGNRLAASGMQPLPSKELFHYFDQLFLCESPQVMAVDINFDQWAENNPKTTTNALYAKVLSARVSPVAEEKSVAFSSVAAALKHLKQEIKQAISSVTKINPHKIKEDDTFKSYGVDSLLALQIKNKLQKDLDVALNVSVIWSHPTVNKLADFLLKALKIEEQLSTTETKAEASENAARPTPVMPAKSGIEAEVENLSLDELLKQLNDKVN